jgi:hypothetical protein
MYAGRTRNGFTPSSREKLFKRFRRPEVDKCPFANLPELKAGRWGVGLTALENERVPMVRACAGWGSSSLSSGLRTVTYGIRGLWGCGRTRSRATFGARHSHRICCKWRLGFC